MSNPVPDPQKPEMASSTAIPRVLADPSSTSPDADEAIADSRDRAIDIAASDERNGVQTGHMHSGSRQCGGFGNGAARRVIT